LIQLRCYSTIPSGRRRVFRLRRSSNRRPPSPSNPRRAKRSRLRPRASPKRRSPRRVKTMMKRRALTTTTEKRPPPKKT
jgi:hypothetical protein